MKRTRQQVENTTETYSHQYKMSMSLYLSVLPTDLLRLLILYFPATDILFILRNLQDILNFIPDKQLWKTLWSRDISSFVQLPNISKDEYHELFNRSYNNKLITILAEKGYDILLYPLLIGANDNEINNAFAWAAHGGHVPIVQKLSNKENINHRMGIIYAVGGGHIEIVKLLLEKLPSTPNNTKMSRLSYNDIMYQAAYMGHIDIVKLMLERGADDVHYALCEAAAGGYEDIADLLILEGANNYGEALANATANGNEDVIRVIKSHMKT